MFNLNAGEIKENTTVRINSKGGLGGGIYATVGGTFNMYGGFVSNNTTGKDGGGIAANGGTINIYDGTISGNKSSYTATGQPDNSSNGGGIWIAQSNGGVLHMSGGTVSGNEAEYGGGIEVNCDTTTSTITGGTITGNIAGAYGGGIHLDKGSNLDISGTDSKVTITENEASAGGGICAYNSDGGSNSLLTIGSNVLITKNDATNGGGIYTSAYAEITVSGAEITYNHSSTFGGGVYVGGMVIFTYVMPAIFTMNSGVLYGNTADKFGADLSGSLGSTITLPTATDMGLSTDLVDNWYFDQEDTVDSATNATTYNRFATTDSTTIAPNAYAYGDSTVLDIIAAATHDLSYDANGGSGTVPASVENEQPGTVVTVGSDSGISYTDYIFLNWNTKADGSGDTYAVGGTITLNSDVTLYAQWAPEYCTVTFDSQGGSAVNSITGVPYNTTIAEPTDPTYSGYIFEGWYKCPGIVKL